MTEHAKHGGNSVHCSFNVLSFHKILSVILGFLDISSNLKSLLLIITSRYNIIILNWVK